ncbi:rhomboid family intramembrane serine protease [Hymenobacter guriensis]|uniref:Rhomboid family intramembrane serine protease n=1 Tax=Hymenobacter guriensis TaxID=2793065 RepID=A0ABS0KY38_9BACT|nr:rhomboid family intramembrane serine protease [Hymenobacter guriensis]MBG8552268.1 rhomboid family intramembrane serine protease [Hymenobacter guriensis]
MFRLTPAVRNLILVNVALFFLQGMFPLLTVYGSLHPIGSALLYPWQFVTYMFLHDGLGHLFSNMITLLFFGASLEDEWGGKKFITFWLICGLGAGFIYEGVRYYELREMNESRLAFHEQPSGVGFADFFREHLPQAGDSYAPVARQMQKTPDDQRLIDSATQTIDSIYMEVMDSPNSGMLGASGAVFGILFALAYLFPNQKMFIFPIPVPISIWLYVFLFSAYSLWKGVHPTPGDNVAHFAHLGGMLIGFIVLKVWERRGI